MKATAKVLATKDNLAYIELDKMGLKVGDTIDVRWGKKRSLRANSLYWVYLTWVINEGGLKEQGHFSPEALHIDLKTHLLATKKLTKGIFKIVEVGSTADKDNKEFSQYLEIADQFICEFFGIDTSPFWRIHGELYS